MVTSAGGKEQGRRDGSKSVSTFESCINILHDQKEEGQSLKLQINVSKYIHLTKWKQNYKRIIFLTDLWIK